MIREYQADPEWCCSGEPGAWAPTWSNKRAVNLRYVTSVRPYANVGVLISLIGETSAFAICEEYDRFVRDWMNARQ